MSGVQVGENKSPICIFAAQRDCQWKVPSLIARCLDVRWSKCKRCSENIELKYLSSAGEREDVRTKYNSTHYYKLALTGLKPSKLAANRFYFSLVSRDTILNQRLISRELLPRLPSCQPRRQPALVKLLACVSWRGNYLLSRHSIYSIYSIYRYLQQHCVMAETHHSQLSAAREVGKNYQTLVNKFFSLWISNQDCVLCLVFFVSLYKHRHHKAVVCHYLFPPVRYLWSVLYWVHWLLGAAPVSSSQNLPVSPVHSGYSGECQHRTTAGTMAQVHWLHKIHQSTILIFVSPKSSLPTVSPL